MNLKELKKGATITVISKEKFLEIGGQLHEDGYIRFGGLCFSHEDTFGRAFTLRELLSKDPRSKSHYEFEVLFKVNEYGSSKLPCVFFVEHYNAPSETVHSNSIQMTLTKQWFEMTRSGEKKEDYREITPYWATRFLGKNQAAWAKYLEQADSFRAPYYFANQSRINYALECLKFFDTNIMTLGYPKKDNHQRILKLNHKGVEIRTGNPEWGAKKGKIYFVLMHGSIIEELE